MIHAFKDSLKRLVADPEDRFHTHVRARIGKKATDHFEGKVKEFILRMPSVVSRIGRMISLEKEGSVVDRLAKYLLIYLYDPMDFLPEKNKGLFGYLDDAYFVAIVYIMILEKTDPSLGSSEDEQTKKWIYTSLESVRYLIPEESRKIDKTVSDIVTNQVLNYPAAVK